MASKTNDLLYVHPVKTGGGWTEYQLLKHLSAETVPDQHLPLRSMLDHAKGRLVVGTVRSPFTWYGSLYAHIMCNGADQHEQLSQYGRGSTKFRDVLYGFTHPDEVEIPENPIVISNSSYDDIERLTKQGLWSWYMWSMCSLDERWALDVTLKQENLTAELGKLIGVDLSTEKHTNLRMKKANHDAKLITPYETWYDAEMMDWIKRSDSGIMDLLGYDASSAFATSQ